MFAFGDFNVYHEWLTYFCGTNRPGKLCYDFSISNDFTQMVNFPTRVPDSDSEIFLSVDASICSTDRLPHLGNSDPAVVFVSADLSSSSRRQGMPLFNAQLMHFFPADWYNLCDQLKNVPWEDILRLGAFATGTEFYEWVLTGSDVSITHYKYQLILHLF